MDAIYKRMDDDTERVPQNEWDQNTDSFIREFYSGKTIFFTGCTGFIGKCIVEKLLRACTDIKHLYALVRPKRGKTMEERMKAYLQDSVFDRVRAENPDFAKKFVAIEGDLCQENLGLSVENRRLIVENADIVIHNAASVSFFTDLSNLLKVNVIGTKMVLDLLRECRRVECFVYVSTAFSYTPDASNVQEKLNEAPMDLATAEQMIKLLDAGLQEKAIVPSENKWWNLYTFTKGTTEGVVTEFGKTAPFPCVIFRPSVVTGAVKEPSLYWNSTKNGPNLLLMAYGLGVLHTLAYNPQSKFDMVPVDYTTNALISIVWHATTFRQGSKECLVYHYASSKVNPALIYAAVDYIKTVPKRDPPMKAVWAICAIEVTSVRLFMILHFLFHVIPGTLVDVIMFLQGKKPKFLALLKQTQPYIERTCRFFLTDWSIEVKNMYDVWKRMSPKDHELFCCDIRSVDWDDYYEQYWRGLRVYVLKDPLDTLPAARKKQRRLKILHYTLTRTLLFLFLYFLYRCVF